AVYAASEGLDVVLLERDAVGGQAGSSSLIENYLGFPEGIAGADLAERAREQAVRFGAELLVMREGVRGVFHDGRIHADLADGGHVVAVRTSARPVSSGVGSGCSASRSCSAAVSTTVPGRARRTAAPASRSSWSAGRTRRARRR
ncbi:hypothetical protein Q3H92_08845, partial [Curtobacterium flaccumfaciens]|nr:hypothetical protein [Curtobacterium flaccumfaciens]